MSAPFVINLAFDSEGPIVIPIDPVKTALTVSTAITAAYTPVVTILDPPDDDPG